MRTLGKYWRVTGRQLPRVSKYKRISTPSHYRTSASFRSSPHTTRAPEHNVAPLIDTSLAYDYWFLPYCGRPMETASSHQEARPALVIRCPGSSCQLACLDRSLTRQSPTIVKWSQGSLYVWTAQQKEEEKKEGLPRRPRLSSSCLLEWGPPHARGPARHAVLRALEGSFLPCSQLRRAAVCSASRFRAHQAGEQAGRWEGVEGLCPGRPPCQG